MLTNQCRVRLRILNLMGQTVCTLVEARQDAGSYNVMWNGLTDNGLYVPSGIYLVRLEAGTVIQTLKIVVVQ